jgi:hypothetical protein
MDFDDDPPQAFETGSEHESVAAHFERFNRPQLGGQDSASATIGKQSDDEESHAAMTPDIDTGFVTLNLHGHARTHRAALGGGIFPSLSVLGGIAISSFFWRKLVTCRRIFMVKDPDRNAINGRLSALRPGVGRRRRTERKKYASHCSRGNLRARGCQAHSKRHPILADPGGISAIGKKRSLHSNENFAGGAE